MSGTVNTGKAIRGCRRLLDGEDETPFRKHLDRDDVVALQTQLLQETTDLLAAPPG